MYDPDFDPLADLHQLIMEVATQHAQIQGLTKCVNEQNIAIKNLTKAMKMMRDQVVALEAEQYAVDTSTTNHRPRR